MRPQRQLMQFDSIPLMQMQAPQQQQGPSMGEAIGAAGSNLAGAYAQKQRSDAWSAALQSARPNPEAPVSTTQGAPPPLMKTRRSGFNPMALQQLQEAVGYGGY